MTDPTVSCSIDLSAPGKQIGHLALPKLTNTAGWASTFVHIASIARGAGPTVLVLAGNHGDEYEGQVAAMRLQHELQPEQVHGRVIVVPVLSPAASKANTRNWPSGANFNRSFPGRPDGPPNEQLADFLTRVLFPLADVVIDMHSGGRSAWFIPCSHMHVVDDPLQRKAMLEGMEAWLSDWHFLYIDVNGTGLLPVEAENQGKVVITTELGGGGRVPAPVHRLAWSGLTNVLRHVGVLEGEVETRASRGLPPAVILDGRNPDTIVLAPEDGLFEALLEPGDAVSAGEPVGRLWFLDRPDRPPDPLLAPLDGVVAVTKAIPVTEQGDCVFVLGVPVDRSKLLEGMAVVEQTFSTTHCAFGVARRDVTPPAGIYSRSWGAATHDVAEGVHRPLTVTAAVFAPLAGDGPTLALVALDIGWFQYAPDEVALRTAVMERAGLREAELLVQMSHTHAAANTNSRLEGRPGTELIAPYLEHLTAQVCDAVLEARSTSTEAFLTYGQGHCGLAANRDLWDADAGRYACGYAPDEAADDTVMVARATDGAGRTLATLFNYACHPTTLAWENRLLSPDYVGAAREVLEGAFAAPALFLQGASGELAPRDDYVGDPAVADRNGRQLGHAAAAAVEALPPPGARFVYTGIVASGANLGTWAYQPCESAQLAAAASLETVLTGVDLARKEDLGVVESLSSETPDSPEEREKAVRREFLRLALGEGPVHRMPIWAWRLGEALLLAVPNEPYSVFQVELRRRFAGTPLLVLMTTNGGVGYMPPRETYGSGRYQEQQSPYAPGCLESAIDAAAATLEPLRPRSART